MNDFKSDIENYIKAGVPVLSISTYEWQRLHGHCVKVSNELERGLYTWSQVGGIDRWSDSEKRWVKEEDIRDPIDVLEWFKKEKSNLILLLEDFHPFLESQHHQILRHLREITRLDTPEKKTLLIQGIQMLKSDDLAKEVPGLTLSSPNHEALCVIIDNVTTSLAFDFKPADEIEKNEIATASLGMGSVEAEWTYKKIIAEKGRLTPSEIPLIIQEKEQIIKKGGVLEYYHPESDFSSVGGMENLKIWLKQRGKAFTQDAKYFGLVAPKGVMLLGIPGCGKSLLAKTISNEWELPLLKFDLGKVFGGIVGESESNIRKALSLAETIAPSILWIDEIEKGLSGLSGGGDSGTSARVFGHLLTWMQDKSSDVFVVATANNIEQL
ncbi:MAG: AAA family ATPase, partial [Ghiorsea sp.]|nr:AAA family ATPase [Ghiorsea sp.]